ncbi:MAG: chemotaxis protein CheD, partial [Planctomycetota bacterium]
MRSSNGKGLVVGVADMVIGAVEDDQIVTYALGSCIGLTAYDPVARVGGLLHFMLPQPSAKSEPKELK